MLRSLGKRLEQDDKVVPNQRDKVRERLREFRYTPTKKKIKRENEKDNLKLKISTKNYRISITREETFCSMSARMAMV